MRRRHVQPLLDAINGQPDEPTAVRQIASWTVIPTAMTGILGGAVLTPQQGGFEVLLLYGAVGGMTAGAVTLAAVVLVYRLFGFGPVVRVGEAVFGLLVGFYLGAALGVGGDLGWWPLLLAPAFAVLNVVFRPFTRLRPKPPPPDE